MVFRSLVLAALLSAQFLAAQDVQFQAAGNSLDGGFPFINLTGFTNPLNLGNGGEKSLAENDFSSEINENFSDVNEPEDKLTESGYVDERDEEEEEDEAAESAEENEAAKLAEEDEGTEPAEEDGAADPAEEDEVAEPVEEDDSEDFDGFEGRDKSEEVEESQDESKEKMAESEMTNGSEDLDESGENFDEHEEVDESKDESEEDFGDSEEVNGFDNESSEELKESEEANESDEAFETDDKFNISEDEEKESDENDNDDGTSEDFNKSHTLSDDNPEEEEDKSLFDVDEDTIEPNATANDSFDEKYIASLRSFDVDDHDDDTFNDTETSFENGEPSNDEWNPNLLEGDIMLSKEQHREMLERKLAYPTSRKWPTTIPYRRGDRTISASGVRRVLRYWRSHTCLKFREVRSNFTGPHLVFRHSPTTCSSFVGRQNGRRGQIIRISPRCFRNFGSAIHEVGHAIGFYNEMSRSDRDRYVSINRRNMRSGFASAFAKRRTRNLEPYDYASIMHYSQHAGSANRRPTIVASNPLFEHVMGQRRGLSFRDKKAANEYYGCMSKNLRSCRRTRNPCRYGGYLGRNCRCVCTPGTIGSNCQTRRTSYNTAVLRQFSPLSGTTTLRGSNRYFGSPRPSGNDVSFVKIYKVGPNQRIRVQVFRLHMRDPEGSGRTRACYKDYVSFNGGTRLCGKRRPRSITFTTSGNTLVISYRSVNRLSCYHHSGFAIYMTSVSKFNSGNSLPLLHSGQGGCRLVKRGSTWYQIVSARWNQGEHRGTRCTLRLRTTEPRFLWVKSGSLRHEAIGGQTNITSVGSLAPFHDHLWDAGKWKVVPSSNAVISYKSSTTRRSPSWLIDIFVRNSNCHKKIVMLAGDSGTLSMINYRPGTICEYWLRAPRSCKVLITIRSFDLGRQKCASDFMLINRYGYTSYQSRNQRYCGRLSPRSIKSHREDLTIHFQGNTGGNRGYSIQYRAVRR